MSEAYYSHVLFKNLNVISDSRVCSFPCRYQKCRREMAFVLHDFEDRCSKRVYVQPNALKARTVIIFAGYVYDGVFLYCPFSHEMPWMRF